MLAEAEKKAEGLMTSKTFDYLPVILNKSNYNKKYYNGRYVNKPTTS